MKNVKTTLCLADFENELENLNHSEMKELVGGTYESYSCPGPGAVNPTANNAIANYIGYLNFYSNMPTGSTTNTSHGGGSAAVTPAKETPKEIIIPTQWPVMFPGHLLVK